MKSLIELLFKGFRKKRNIIKESSFLEIIDKIHIFARVGI